MLSKHFDQLMPNLHQRDSIGVLRVEQDDCRWDGNPVHRHEVGVHTRSHFRFPWIQGGKFCDARRAKCGDFLWVLISLWLDLLNNFEVIRLQVPQLFPL
jgi:hypothetical protein